MRKIMSLETLLSSRTVFASGDVTLEVLQRLRMYLLDVMSKVRRMEGFEVALVAGKMLLISVMANMKFHFVVGVKFLGAQWTL